MEHQKYTDIEIVSGCKKGNIKMQEALYNLYASRMIAVCSRYTNDRMEAEDIFHDTFIKVFEKIKGFNGGSLKSWMYRVFINSSIDYYKANNKYNEIQYEDVQIENGNHLEIISNLTTNELTVIINQLPVGYKMVFNMFVVDGFSHKEIAETLNITEGTSKSQLFKAKAMLVERLKMNQISRFAM